jgi:hypothetical protein
MRGIFTISALHLSRLCPNKRDLYVAIAKSEHECALQSATKLLRNVTAGNYSALFIFSLMTFFYALASPRKQGDMLLANSNGIADWMVVFRGMRQISDSAMEELIAGPFGALFIRGKSTALPSIPPTTSWTSSVEFQQIAMLRQLVSRAVADHETLAIYLENIETLEVCFCRYRMASATWCKRGIPDGVDPGESLTVPETSIVLAWPYQTCSEYVELLVQRQPEALAIFAYYCVIMKSLEGCWWMQGWPSYLIQEIWATLGVEHRLWIQWPIEEIGWQPQV